MNFKHVWRITRLYISGLYVLTAAFSFPAPGYADSSSVNIPNERYSAPSKQSVVAPKATESIREDYFISADTVIIGCTSGMAAGVLVGSVPMAGAVMSGIGVPESVSLLVNLAGMGCGVGAVSSAVAILTAWMLARNQ